MFEGNKDFEDLARPFDIEWTDLERVTRTIVKRYNAEIHSQSAIELLLDLGRIATSGADDKPHVVPTSFRYNAELDTIDVGGLHVATTKKYRDVEANPWAALVVDDLVSTDPWTPRMLEIRGRAEAIASGGDKLGPGVGAGFIRIYPEKVNSFGIG